MRPVLRDRPAMSGPAPMPPAILRLAVRPAQDPADEMYRVRLSGDVQGRRGGLRAVDPARTRGRQDVHESPDGGMWSADGSACSHLQMAGVFGERKAEAYDHAPPAAIAPAFVVTRSRPGSATARNRAACAQQVGRCRMRRPGRPRATGTSTSPDKPVSWVPGLDADRAGGGCSAAARRSSRPLLKRRLRLVSEARSRRTCGCARAARHARASVRSSGRNPPDAKTRQAVGQMARLRDVISMGDGSSLLTSQRLRRVPVFRRWQRPVPGLTLFAGAPGSLVGRRTG